MDRWLKASMISFDEELMMILRSCVCCWVLCLAVPLWIGCAPERPQPIQLTPAAGERPKATGSARPQPAPAPKPLSDRVVKRGRSYRVRVDGAERVQAGDHVDVLATVPEGAKKRRVTITLLPNIIVLRRSKDGWLALLVLQRESEKLALASRIASLYVVRRHPKDPQMDPDRVLTSTPSLRVQSQRDTHRKKRLAGFQKGLQHKNRKRRGPGLVRGAREICLPLSGAQDVVAGDSLDVVATVRDASDASDAAAADWVSFTLVSDVVVSDKPWRPSRRGTAGCVPVLMTSRESQRAVQALRMGTLSASLRNPRDVSVSQHARPMTVHTLLHGERSGCSFGKDRTATIAKIKVIRNLPGLKRTPPPKSRPRAVVSPPAPPPPRGRR